jgi:hypothetical protein
MEEEEQAVMKTVAAKPVVSADILLVCNGLSTCGYCNNAL